MEDCDLVTVDNSGVGKYILGFWGLPQNCRQRIQGMVRLTLTLTLTLLIIGMGYGSCVDVISFGIALILNNLFKLFQPACFFFVLKKKKAHRLRKLERSSV